MSNDMPEPILITGCARSGTSCIAGIIHLCGAFGGVFSGPNHNNKRGMFENSKARNELLKPYIESLGVDRLGQYPLPDISTLKIKEDFGQKLKAIMVEQGYKEGAPWMYKGPKMTLIWPTLHKSFPNAKWVIVRRNTENIINSCIKTSFMKAFHKREILKAVGVATVREGWLWWVNQHLKRFQEMEDAGLNIKYVWPEKILEKKDYTEIKETIAWLGLEWNDKDVKNFVTPELWNTSQKVRG
jgi:hypothetical protein